jgi:hypothetical protein
MLAVSSNPNWLQLFLGGSIGVLLTFILARGLDTVRNRPYLEVRLQETQERLYVRNDGMGGSPRFIVCDPGDPNAELVITLDLLCVNHSYQRDGLIAAELSLENLQDRIAGRVRADEPFLGMNVDAHSIQHVRLRYFVHKQSQGSHRGYADEPLWSEDPLPNMTLAVETVRQRSNRRWWPPAPIRSTQTLPVVGANVRRTHREGVGTLQIHYLNKPPPVIQPAATNSPIRRLASILRRHRHQHPSGPART